MGGKHYDLRPEAMIKRFDLRKPIYYKAAGQGSFGRSDVLFPWEAIDRKALDDLKAMI